MQRDYNSDTKAPTLAMENKNPCAVCRPYKVPVCPGHAAGGGGGGGGAGSKEQESEATGSKEKATLYFNIQITNDGAVTASNQKGELVKVPDELAKALLELKKVFDELLILNDEQRNLLTIQLKPKHRDYDELQKLQALLQAIQNECHQFLKNKNFGSRYTADLADHKLIIQIPDKELYHDFIIHLAANALSLVAKANQELGMKQKIGMEAPREKEAHTEKGKYQSQSPSPTPFGDIKNGPRPKGVKTKTKKEE